MNANLILISKDELQTMLNQAVNSADHAQKVIPPPSNNQPKFLSIGDMCEMFGVSRITISTWMKQGRIPFFKVSRRVYFNLSEVMESLPQFNLSTVQSFQKSLKQGVGNDGRK